MRLLTMSGQFFGPRHIRFVFLVYFWPFFGAAVLGGGGGVCGADAAAG